MPNYRVYYVEREGGSSRDALARVYGSGDTSSFKETEWEEEVEARNPREAVTRFFGEHVQSRSGVMWVDEAGQGRPIEGIGDYDPERTYIWMEGDKLMRYERVEEFQSGMTTCPLCGGRGQVEEGVAEEFLSEYVPEGEEEG